MTFQEKVRGMKASEIIMAMVEALTHPPIVNIDMSTYGNCIKTVKTYFFGLIKREKKVCFGCAATNTICGISGKTFKDESIDNISGRARIVNSDMDFLDQFEGAINALRTGAVTGYNYYAKRGEFARIDFDFVNEWRIGLGNDYTNEHLEPFIALAERQKRYENGEVINDDDEFFRI